MTLTEDNFRSEKIAIPFPEIKRAMRSLPYGSYVSVMFKFLACTGARVRELNLMRRSLLCQCKDDPNAATLYWQCGKNQKGYRKEKIPDWLLTEYMIYTEQNKTFQDRLFGCESQVLEKRFRKFRPLIGGAWMRRVWLQSPCARKEEFFYTLAGLRKSFTTLQFAKESAKYKNDFHVGLLMVSARLKHSSCGLTARHYCREFEGLNIWQYAGQEIGEILRHDSQKFLRPPEALSGQQPLVAWV